MLSTERITLRPLEPQDLEFLYRWENDTTLWQYADTVAPLSQHLLRNYIDNYDADIFRASQLRLMIEHRHRDIVDKHGYPDRDRTVDLMESAKTADCTIGMIDIYDLDIRNQRAMIGILIAEKWRGNGYAREAIDLVADYARDMLGLSQLAAYVATDNEASMRLFEACGFSHDGTLRRWRRVGQRWTDVAVMQRLF